MNCTCGGACLLVSSHRMNDPSGDNLAPAHPQRSGSCIFHCRPACGPLDNGTRTASVVAVRSESIALSSKSSNERVTPTTSGVLVDSRFIAEAELLVTRTP